MKDESRPTISVIIPAYNRAQTLPRAIRSVFEQSFHDWEIIIVDDASSDETEQVVREWVGPRISYLRHAHNRGPSPARNTGIQAARGTFVAFLDSDDEWLPEKLANDIAVFRSHGDDLGLVYGGEFFLDAHGGQVKLVPAIGGRVYDQLLARDFIGSCSRVTVRRSALETVGGFDEGLVNEEDWDLWVRIAKAFEIGFVPQCLVKRHFGPGQITSNLGSLRRIFEGKARVIEKHRSQMPAPVLARHLAVLAGLLFNYDISRARGLALESLRLKISQPRLLSALVISLFGVNTYRYVFSRWAGLMHSLYMGRANV